jgi:hypothetical protein
MQAQLRENPHLTRMLPAVRLDLLALEIGGQFFFSVNSHVYRS